MGENMRFEEGKEGEKYEEGKKEWKERKKTDGLQRRGEKVRYYEKEGGGKQMRKMNRRRRK